MMQTHSQSHDYAGSMIGHFGPFAMLLVVIVAIWAMLMVLTAAQHRKHTSSTDLKICPGCSTPHPGHAEFCRNCGRKLS
ncbi:hypothetical protein BH10PLA1_BH10PLA1_07380 [soil metagenome]